MDLYKIDYPGCTIPDLGKIKSTLDEFDLNEIGRGYLFMTETNEGTRVTFIPLEVDLNHKVFQVIGHEVKFLGKVSKDVGNKIILSSLDDVSNCETDKAKKAYSTKKRKAMERAESRADAIDRVEKTIPKSVLPIWNEILVRIDGHKESYKTLLCNDILSENLELQSDKWFEALTWFRTKILDRMQSESTFYMLRKSFVTSLRKFHMFKSKSAMAIDESNDEDFWSDYAKNKE